MSLFYRVKMIVFLLRFAQDKIERINKESMEKVGDVAILTSTSGIPVMINPDFRLIYKVLFRFEVIYKPQSYSEKNLGIF